MMADNDEPQFTTLAERIAALNRQKNFQAPPPAVGKRPPPPPPPGRAATDVAIRTTAAATSEGSTPGKSPAIPARPVRAATDKGPPPLPRRTTERENGERLSAPPVPSPGRSLPPPLPARSSQNPSPPKLPARQPSTQNLTVRRNSNSSDVSQLSAVSSLSLNRVRSKSPAPNGTSEAQPPRRLPPTLDQAKLPPLPPTRREREAKAKEAAEKQAANATPSLPPRRTADPPKPSLPPRLPSRPAANTPAVVLPQAEQPAPGPALPTRRLPPPPASYQTPKSALECGFNSKPKPTPSSTSPPSPPPVPLSSRPTLAEIDAAASRIAASSPHLPPHPPAQPPPPCLTCRDFSLPDQIAAQHPTSSIAHLPDPIGHLAVVLCASLPSLTDKARAIFTWLHHNLAYDVHGFFNGCIPRGQTPAESLLSGKAVCEGYARVFQAIALAAGLECLVVTGHGKGYGFQPVKKNTPPPPRDPTGHAWNAVRIDGGAWKLVDACWGAGAVADGRYVKRFAPECFAMTNERFGLKHYPADDAHWFRADGRAVPWDEYILGPLRGGDEPAEWMGNATEEGLDEFNFEPRQRRIPVAGGSGDGGAAAVVRFRFGKVCEHWTPEKHGKGPQMLFALKIGGLDGRCEDMVPLEYDGLWYFLDVNARDLGAPGQKVMLIGFDTVDGRSARGLTREEWLSKKGRCGYSYCVLVRWELV
ncbi:hypothetical protein VTK26DRAFT_7231 [Humicola hyalothermophila]